MRARFTSRDVADRLTAEGFIGKDPGVAVWEYLQVLAKFGHVVRGGQLGDPHFRVVRTTVATDAYQPRRWR